MKLLTHDTGNILTDGLIPANTECPFLQTCDKKNPGQCMAGHQGKLHTVPFSCAFARGLDIMQEGKASRGENHTGNLVR